jgi:hypothetical protein
LDITSGISQSESGVAFFCAPVNNPCRTQV